MLLEGAYTGEARAEQPVPADGFVVFAGRHIPEKNVPALVPAMAAVRREHALRAEILGDGPERPAVEALVAEHGLQDAVAVRGFVSSQEVDDKLRRAVCMVLPSAARATAWW